MVAGAATPSAADSRPRVTGSTHPCTTSELTVSLVRGLFGLGNAGAYIGFTNRGSTPCRITGWPTLVALGSTGEEVPARHVRSTYLGPDSARGVPVVTLRPGARADAVFAGTDNPDNTRPPNCGSTIRRLRVTPPGDSAAVLVSAWIPTLREYLPGCQTLSVTMVVPASSLWRG